MRKYGNRVPLFYCVTDEVQFLQEIRLFNEEIHWTHLRLSFPNNKTPAGLVFIFSCCKRAGRGLRGRTAREFPQARSHAVGIELTVEQDGLFGSTSGSLT